MLISDEVQHTSAASLMSVRYFQADPDTMPEGIFSEHHVL
jgi:AraC family transcriptional regulator